VSVCFYCFPYVSRLCTFPPSFPPLLPCFSPPPLFPPCPSPAFVKYFQSPQSIMKRYDDFSFFASLLRGRAGLPSEPPPHDPQNRSGSRGRLKDKMSSSLRVSRYLPFSTLLSCLAFCGVFWPLFFFVAPIKSHLFSQSALPPPPTLCLLDPSGSQVSSFLSRWTTSLGSCVNLILRNALTSPSYPRPFPIVNSLFRIPFFDGRSCRRLGDVTTKFRSPLNNSYG